MVIALCEHTVQLPISSLATPIFPTNFVTVEALHNNMRQCSSYSGHTHFQLLNRAIHSNTEVECLASSSMIVLRKLRTCTRLICAGTFTEVRRAPARPSPLSSNIRNENSARKTSNLHPSDLRWNAYRSQAGSG